MVPPRYWLAEAIPLAVGAGMVAYGQSQGRSLPASVAAGAVAYVGTIGGMVGYFFSGGGAPGVAMAAVPVGLGIVLPARLLTKG